MIDVMGIKVNSMLDEVFDQAKLYVQGARAQQKLFEEEK